jgi:hypothetical protein
MKNLIESYIVGRILLPEIDPDKPSLGWQIYGLFWTVLILWFGISCFIEMISSS